MGTYGAWTVAQARVGPCPGPGGSAPGAGTWELCESLCLPARSPGEARPAVAVGVRAQPSFALHFSYVEWARVPFAFLRISNHLSNVKLP